MEEPGIVVTLKEIHDQMLLTGRKVDETDRKVDLLTNSIGELVAVNKRLDLHHKTLNEHDQRLDILEIAKAVSESNAKPKTPWYSTVGAIVGILAGSVSLIILISLLGDISNSLSGTQ